MLASSFADRVLRTCAAPVDASALAAAKAALAAAGAPPAPALHRIAAQTPYGPDTTDPLTTALLAGALPEHRHRQDGPAGPAWAWRVCAAAATAVPEPAAGRDPAVAVLIGAELAVRLATALGPRHAAVWDPAGSVGVLGAAVTACLAGGATQDRLTTALCIAASLTGGHRVHDGTPLGDLTPGFAAAAGVLAAALAGHGVTASPTALEGPRGLLFAYGDRTAAATLLEGFGTVWTVLEPQEQATPVPARPVPAGPDLAARLAAFSSGLDLDAVPESARHAGRRALANVVGLAVDAAAHPAVLGVAETLRDLGLRGDVPVAGRGGTVSGYAAALLMGYAMHVEDFDDTHLRTVLHPGAPVVGAALAAAALVGADGRDVLAGVVAGIEVGSRVGIALGPGHFDRGWHVTGTAGHVGAAAAAARVLRLDAEQTRHALAIAGSLAAGVTEQLGSMTKALHVGRSAADGLQAVLLAGAGLTGAADPFGAPTGLAAALAPAYDPDAALERLGDGWEVEENAFKPYSCGIVSHSVIDAAIAARDAGLPAADIERVVATVRPVVLEVMGVREPVDGLQSKFSVYHCFAVGMLDGGAGPAQYTDARATDPQVVGLRRKVEAVTDPAMPKDACRVQVWLPGGVTHTFTVQHATGSVAAPMTDAQLEAKFRLLTVPVLGDDGAARRWRAAMNVDAPGGDLRELVRA
ncbi:hypothetical protein GCM10009827_012640 [Dactylosporangium maewongense]|uniref:2-methylcitrate dehydratase PrpD n=1 Tax=Dactylosporangium maewongense TaxID=634393 RepID=A0ABN1ZPU7_9ACTN